MEPYIFYPAERFDVPGKTRRSFYYRVTASMMEKTAFEREMAPLRAIHDNYPQTVITLDRFTPGDYDGIVVINAIHWPLNRG